MFIRSILLYSIECYNCCFFHQVTEKEFWTEFFQSQYFHRDRIQKSTSTKDVFGELAKKDEEGFLSFTFRISCCDYTSVEQNTSKDYQSILFKCLNNLSFFCLFK